jgi:hypothetical protein
MKRNTNRLRVVLAASAVLLTGVVWSPAGFAPGDSMVPGSTIAGVAVPIILDRHCGNM